jgi:hypothetical protein
MFYSLLHTKCSPQGPTIVGTGSGTPEVPEIPNARRYSWATLSPGVINAETWFSRLGVGRGANNPTPYKTAVTEPQERRPRPDMGCRAIEWMDTKLLNVNNVKQTEYSLYI